MQWQLIPAEAGLIADSEGGEGREAYFTLACTTAVDSWAAMNLARHFWSESTREEGGLRMCGSSREMMDTMTSHKRAPLAAAVLSWGFARRST